jgi:hypothetical protein
MFVFIRQSLKRNIRTNRIHNLYPDVGFPAKLISLLVLRNSMQKNHSGSNGSSGSGGSRVIVGSRSPGGSGGPAPKPPILMAPVDSVASALTAPAPTVSVALVLTVLATIKSFCDKKSLTLIFTFWGYSKIILFVLS